MSDNQELLQALNGIHAELQAMNKTLSTLAARQSHAPQAEAPRPAFPAKGRPPASGRSQYGGGFKRSPEGGFKRNPEGGFKRNAEEGGGGEPRGYGAEMAARFPKSSGSPRPKSKAPAKKGGGYPKKPR